MPSTNVPSPVFGPNGFVAPSEAAILAGVMTDLVAIFGGDLNPGLSTPQGQLATTETAVIGDSNAVFLWYVNQVDPALNSGRMQDGIGRIYFMQRIAGSPSVQACVCSGLDEVTIPVGALVQDENQVLWVCQNAGTISGGSVTLNFACVNNGPTPGPVSLTIYQAVFGWDSCVPTGDAAPGNNVETPSEFEARRAASVAANARSILDSVQGTVLALPNVLDVYCTENVEGFAQVIGGVVVGANSIYVCVLGGLAQDVANAIWTKKAPGAGYTGNTVETVVDPSPKYLPPPPSYQVAFETPAIVPFAVLVTLRNGPNVPANALSMVQALIVAAFAGLDGGPRAKIGSTVYASRYYILGATEGASWIQIVSIQVGAPTGSAASFTASISGTLMTVSAVGSGSLAAGQLLQDAGSVLASGTTIVSQQSGSAGGTGTYLVSPSQSVSSEAMNATNMANDVPMNINQAPAVSAVNVQLKLV